MSTRPSPRQRIINLLLQIYCWGLILLILYVLSIGPLYWYWYDAYHLGGNDMMARFYIPLALACESCSPLDDWVHWYIGVWNNPSTAPTGFASAARWLLH